MGCAALVIREVAATPYGSCQDPTPEASHRFGAVNHAAPTSMHATDAAIVEAVEAAEDRQPGIDRQPEADDAADPDVIEDLGDEIATLSAHIHAATHRLLVLVAEFDRLRGWELAGYSNCARWLAARTAIDLGTAREKVRAARALTDLPLTSAAMSRGELSFSQVRALTRAARADSEAELLELARGTTTAQLERMVRVLKKGSRKDEGVWEQERYGSRTFSVCPDDDGMYVVSGRLMPEVGALLMRAIEAASDALFHERATAGVPDDMAAQQRGISAAAEGPDAARHCRIPSVAGDTDTEARQRRADAVGLLAERAMAAGFGVTDECGCASREAPISGTRAERYQVVLHVDAQTLSADGEPGRSELEDGTRVSGETARRLTCDASVVKLSHAPDGSILELDRKTRTISPALRRALEFRDRGCRFPGCHLRFTDGHHVRHWSDGGATGLSNCVLVCEFHHTLVHEGGWRVEWWGKGQPVFFDPRGGAHFDGSWKPPELPEQPVEALVHANRLLGVEPDASTVGARWEREQDIPDRVYFPALEAL